MQMTTLCYIEKDNKYLMLHRTKKKNDINEGKWIGVGEMCIRDRPLPLQQPLYRWLRLVFSQNAYDLVLSSIVFFKI